MNVIKAIIVDDEQHNRNVLMALLKKHCPQIEIVAESENVDNAFKVINDHQPELVFLDIKMQGKNGFDLLKLFPVVNFEVIFVSGFDEYAISAFDFNALGYILKPIDYQKLIKAVDKAVLKISSNATNDTVLYFIKSIDDESDLIGKINVHHHGKVIFLNVKEIVTIESKSDNCEIRLANGSQFYSSKDLGLFEDLFSRLEYFIRISKSILLNTNYITGYSKGETCILEMKNGFSYEVSRRKKKEVIQKIKLLY